LGLVLACVASRVSGGETLVPERLANQFLFPRHIPCCRRLCPFAAGGSDFLFLVWRFAFFWCAHFHVQVKLAPEAESSTWTWKSTEVTKRTKNLIPVKPETP